MTKFLVVLAVLLLPVSGVFAAPAILSFDNPTVDGGTISYNGSGGPLVGDAIIFQQVIGVDTPLNSGVSLFCYPVNCLLNFTTGDNLTEGPPVYTFGGGGSLSLVGGLNTAADGSGVQVSPAGTLLAHDGVFDDPSAVLTEAHLFAGTGFDLKDVSLSAYYGLPDAPFSFANTELSIDNSTFDPVTAAFSAHVTDADFANTPVPEPATLFLLGTGLVGAAWISRRRAA